MNLNDFVVLPNNKAKSVKLNARNLQELQMETVTLAQESEEMEEKLQQLKESMSKEKEERGHSGGFRWKSGQCVSLNSNAVTNTTKKDKENKLQKLSAGKLKIRVLKDEPLTAPPQPAPPPPPPPIGLRTTRKNRLRGTCCGQCEVKTAGLRCAECTEDYCVGCFAKFHQKGALKLHRMIPIQGVVCGGVVLECIILNVKPGYLEHRRTGEKRTCRLHLNPEPFRFLCENLLDSLQIGTWYFKDSPDGNQKQLMEKEGRAVTDLQTHVSTLDVVSSFQKQINPGSHPGTFTSFNPSSKPNPNRTIKSNAITIQEAQSPEKGSKAGAKTMQFHPDPSQVLAVNQKTVELTEEGPKREDAVGFPASLLRGEYNEEESARSFQEALRQWRGEKSDGAEEPRSEEAMWTPVRPVSVSAMATQADLAPNGGVEGRGRGGEEGRVPVRVEFTENNLTYMDRLLLKKHHRTPIETYQPSLAFGRDSNLCPNTKTEETASNLTAQEEDFRRYCASLFAVPVSRGKAEPQITTPESCLTIEYLDESDRDMDGDVVAEQRTASNRKVSSAPRVLSEGRTMVPQTALTSGVSSRINHSSPSLQSRAPARPTAAQKLHRSKPQTSQAEHSMKSSSSKSKPSACPTDQTPRTSKTSIKTPTSMSQKPNCFTNVHKSKPDCGSPRLLSSPLLLHSQTEIPKSPYAPVSFPPDVSPLSSARPLIPEEHLSPSPSFSLRSTFIVSPSGSTESALLPKVYQSTPFQKGSDSSLLPEQPQSPWLFPEPMSSLKLSQLPPSNLESSRQSHRSLCEPESLLLVNQLQLPLSPVSSSPNTPPKSLEPSPAVNSLSSLSLFKSPLDAYSRSSSTPTNEDAPLIMSSTPISGDHESDLSLSCIPSLPSHRLNVIQNPPLAGKTEEEEELSIDSGDEMSSDSLGLAPYEEDSSDEEALTDGHLTREEEPGIPATPHQEDLQTVEQEQLSEPSMVMHKLGLSAGSGSERSCDLDGFLPLGLDMNSGHSDTPEHTYCDSVRTRETTPYDSGPTGSEGYWPSSSLSTGTGHLVFSVMEDSQTLPTGIQIHSTTPTRREEISANKPGTSESESNQCGKCTPPLSWVPAACSQSNPRSGSELGAAFRPLSRVAQEIMEICSVDQMGCEDPDLDTDTTLHTLHELEQELRLTAKETGKQVSLFGAGSSGGRDQQANHHFTWGRVSEEQKEEEAAAQRDQLSVLLLP